MKMLDRLTADFFAPYLNEEFRLLRDGQESVPWELMEVQDLGTHESQNGNRSPFSLVFRAPKDYLVPQGILTLEQEQAGRLDIFLVPIGPDAQGMLYEAVFN